MLSTFAVSLELEEWRRKQWTLLLEDPRKVLTASEITSLRKLARTGVGMRARGGWMIGGSWHAEKPFKRFEQLDLCCQTFFNGHKLRLTARGQSVMAELERRRKPRPADLF